MRMVNKKIIMNREIKFRVFDNINYMSNSFTLDDLQFGKIQFTSECRVMQYTGLKDKNGKEIYEGDIIELYAEFHNEGFDDDDRETIIHEGIFSVYYENKIAGFELNRIESNVHGWSLIEETQSDIEVIGNIYETPHLLNSEQSVKESDTTKAT